MTARTPFASPCLMLITMDELQGGDQLVVIESQVQADLPESNRSSHYSKGGAHMPQLDPMPDTCRSAADVRARALAVFERRRAAYEKLATEMPPAAELEPVAEPEMPAELKRREGMWRPIWAEVARQTGINPEHIKKGDESRGQPLTSYRQLAIALTCRLTKLSLNTIAVVFGVRDHTSVIHARNAMRPILDATGLTEAAPVPLWVETCLPFVLVHIAQNRASNRAFAVASRQRNGKFIPAEECQ
jgi:Bacterial dnaA protein helix-turn-helix